MTGGPRWTRRRRQREELLVGTQELAEVLEPLDQRGVAGIEGRSRTPGNSEDINLCELGDYNVFPPETPDDGGET